MNPSSESNQKRVSRDDASLGVPPFLFIALAIALALALAYSNSFHGPFIFDDLQSIVENPSIRSIFHSLELTQKNGETTSTRPVLNFSFALNHAWGGWRSGDITE